MLSYFGMRILDPDRTEECFSFIYTRSFVGIHRVVTRRSRTMKDYFYFDMENERKRIAARLLSGAWGDVPH